MKALRDVETEWEKEKHILNLKKFDFSVLQLAVSSLSHTFLSTINSNTTREQLIENSLWDISKDERIIAINEEIQKFKSTDPQTKIKSSTEFIRRLKIFRNNFANWEGSLLDEASLQKIKDVVNNFVNATKTLKISSEAIFPDLPLDGVGSATWKPLWKSARKFYNESKQRESFPDTNENCPLCLKTLDLPAKQRFENFDELVKNDLQKQYDQANNAYQGLLGELKALDFSIEVYEPTILEIEQIIPDYRSTQTEYISTLPTYQKELIELFQEEETVDDIEVKTILKIAKLTINSLLTQLVEQNAVYFFPKPYSCECI